MKEKEREIWIGKSRFYLGEDNILYETVVGEIDGKMAIAMLKGTSELEDMVEGKVNTLIDLNKAGKTSSKARKIGQEAFEHEKIGKVALFGLNPVARVIASFVMGVTRKKDMRFFGSKEKALAWLKE